MEKEQSENQSIEIFEDNLPKVINDIECVHDYQFTYLDSEGFYNYTCSKCPMGIRSKEERA